MNNWESLLYNFLSNTGAYPPAYSDEVCKFTNKGYIYKSQNVTERLVVNPDDTWKFSYEYEDGIDSGIYAGSGKGWNEFITMLLESDMTINYAYDLTQFLLDDDTLTEGKLSAKSIKAREEDLFDQVYDDLVSGMYTTDIHLNNDPSKPLLKRKVSKDKRILEDRIFANPYGDGLLIVQATPTQKQYVRDVANSYGFTTRDKGDDIIINFDYSPATDPWRFDREEDI